MFALRAPGLRRACCATHLVDLTVRRVVPQPVVSFRGFCASSVEVPEVVQEMPVVLYVSKVDAAAAAKEAEQNATIGVVLGTLGFTCALGGALLSLPSGSVCVLLLGSITYGRLLTKASRNEMQRLCLRHVESLSLVTSLPKMEILIRTPNANRRVTLESEETGGRYTGMDMPSADRPQFRTICEHFLHMEEDADAVVNEELLGKVLSSPMAVAQDIIERRTPVGFAELPEGKLSFTEGDFISLKDADMKKSSREIPVEEIRRVGRLAMVRGGMIFGGGTLFGAGLFRKSEAQKVYV
mmetsp:Transcript_45055/g.119505  ORF Transcript_45055/g.119505 Transcript_45055/m.119505 type:complete len:297 (-) Transcript_45055:307-1197(-)